VRATSLPERLEAESFNSTSPLILARSLQGIGGALLVLGSLALISANFPRYQFSFSPN
jgi:hypothetical protein